MPEAESTVFEEYNLFLCKKKEGKEEWAGRSKRGEEEKGKKEKGVEYGKN